MKICKKCGQEKPLVDFHNDRYRVDGKTSVCAKCRCIAQTKYKGTQREYRKQYQKAHADKHRFYTERARVKRVYGLSLENYNALIAFGRCFICAKTCKPNLDHDHRTGKVRGVLCAACNKGLGFFQDDAMLLRIAAMYVEAHREN